MLAPGDFLTTPPEPHGEPGARGAKTTNAPEPEPTAPTAGVEEPEPRSFLLTLLRALGAIHT